MLHAPCSTRALRAPAPIAPLIAFRIAFGLVMALSVARTMALGRVESLYIVPQVHFPFVAALTPLPGWGMHALFVVLLVAALGVTVGAWYRASIVTFFVGFTYVELLDKSTFLNHYYLVSLLSFLMIWLPLGAVGSVDAWRRGEQATHVPAWMLWALRAQVMLVYAFAGVAKLRSDWLLHALPLGLWLPARADLPLIGPWLDQPWLAYTMSWAGTAFDLTISIWLLKRRTRPYALAAILTFHLLTALLFPTIGLFPWIMIAASLLFLSGERLQPLLPALPTRPVRPAPIATAIVVTLLVTQLLIPLRHWLYPGDLLWTEEGFRFAWHVMIVEKSGSALFRVRDPATGREWVVHPHSLLTPWQERQMSVQPDMIEQFAHLLAARYRTEGLGEVEVYADVFVSLNGRASQRLIDPTANLAATMPTFRHRAWILDRRP